MSGLKRRPLATRSTQVQGFSMVLTRLFAAASLLLGGAAPAPPAPSRDPVAAQVAVIRHLLDTDSDLEQWRTLYALCVGVGPFFHPHDADARLLAELAAPGLTILPRSQCKPDLSGAYVVATHRPALLIYVAPLALAHDGWTADVAWYRGGRSAKGYSCTIPDAGKGPVACQLDRIS
jgi:hypothetical protein